MKERFEFPPLLEIIAELRWDVHAPHAAPGAPIPLLPPMLQPFEESFSELAGALGNLGFRNSERLIPQGFPWMVHEPVIRFRYSGGAEEQQPLKKSSLFQVGAGIFTANAVPPYSSWDDFGPIVREGVEALFACCFKSGAPEKMAPTLRYIDAFKELHTSGASMHKFLSEVMGINISLPDTLNGSGQAMTPQLQIVKPLPFGRLALQFMDGAVNGEKALILDMSVHFDGPVAGNPDAVLDAFSRARDEIHRVFVELTKPIHAVMHPKDGSI
ncbi:TIGR04255 family protein [Pseudomonas sp. LFM046]|uniref:TIGR04255 family protein n=1 Tax=Pseudomonas sp. LFM046 TaxID=1608357 RepID=UPI0005CFD283|nr:TIGR04255 family protein [Pseudomonas sp. LFM046]